MLTVVNGATGGSELSVVVLHGYAMDHQDLAPFAGSLGVPGRFHFPRAPDAAPLGGRAWWPIDLAARAAALERGPRDLWDQYPAQRARARQELLRQLDAPDLFAASAPVVWAGFSQGGMLACDTLLHEPVRLDGLILLSSSRIALNEWQAHRERLKGLPVLVAHGTRDPDLAFAAGQGLRDWLCESGAQVQWVPFEGGHEIPLAVWRQVRTFLRARLPARNNDASVCVVTARE